MAPRPRHIAHAIERSALQKLIITGLLPLFQLHPAGKQTVSMMIEKGWLVQVGQNYRITDAGEAALKTIIPTERRP